MSSINSVIIGETLFLLPPSRQNYLVSHEVQHTVKESKIKNRIQANSDSNTDPTFSFYLQMFAGIEIRLWVPIISFPLYQRATAVYEGCQHLMA